MKALAEVQVIPIGNGVSVRREVQRAHRILEEANLNAQLHSNGTNLEGDLMAIFAAIAKVHEVLHSEGTTRLSTHIKIGTRVDKEPSLVGKLF